MGGLPSKPPPIIREDPSPGKTPVDGIGVGGKTQGCQQCQNQLTKEGCSACKFYIAQGISAASVRMYRETGNVTQEQCNALSIDLARVDANELAFEQVRAKLLDGKYYENLQNGYCGQLTVKAGEEQNIVNKESLSGRLLRPAIRKMTVGGGYSSMTKVFLKPSVPFRVTLNGITEEVGLMTLFHPSPLRIENIQHDAVLTLNDVADSNNKLVVLIPLVGSIAPGPSGQFLGKIASYIPGILRPNPASNQYEPIEVPTGSDWDLSRIFPGKPDPATKQTAATGGFFTWRAVPPVERYLKRSIPGGQFFSDYYEYGWRPIQGVTGPTYVMLQKPIPVNSFDLQTIRMLPVTPTSDAMPPPLLDTVTYTPPTECSAGGATPGAKKETFTNKDASCDPLQNIPPVSTITTDTIFSVVLGLLSTVAVFIGIYFALKYATDNDWGTKIQSWGRGIGKYMAKATEPKKPSATKEETGPTAPKPGPTAPETGPVRRAQLRKGEDFAFTNQAAIELRKKAAQKRAEEEKAAAQKREQEKQLERLKREADEAARKKAADEEVARTRAEEAIGTGLLTREELRANAEKAAEEREAAEEEARSALRRATRRAMTPLQRAKEELRFTQRLLYDLEAARDTAQQYAFQARFNYEKDKSKANKDLMESNAKSYQEALESFERLQAKEKKLMADIEELKRKESGEPKQLKRRVITSSDRDLTAEDKEQKRKDEEMVARLFSPQREYAARTSATSAETPTSRSTEPPAGKKDELAKKLKAFNEMLKKNQERNRATQFTMRRIVDARNKAKTLRASPPKVPSQAEREIERVRAEADRAADQVEADLAEIEKQARKQQAFAENVQAQAKKFQLGDLSDRVKAAMKEAEQTESDAAKTKKEAATQRENIDRDLAAAQSRLRATGSQYTRATQRRNIYTGKGRKH